MNLICYKITKGKIKKKKEIKALITFTDIF